jgi:hypothetical protein
LEGTGLFWSNTDLAIIKQGSVSIVGGFGPLCNSKQCGEGETPRSVVADRRLLAGG